MSEAMRAVIEFAVSNGGVVTRTEAVALGMSPTTLRRKVTEGSLVRLQAGVYMIPGLVNGHLASLHAACRKLGAVASHRSAALLHGLDRPGFVKPTVSVPLRRTKEFNGVTVHQVSDLTDDQIAALDGLPVTTPERTVIDLAAVLKESHVERIIDQGLASRLIEFEHLIELFRRLGRRGKPGTQAMRKILAKRDDLHGQSDSELERRLLKLILDADLPIPVPQFRTEWLRPTNGRVDMAYPDRHLVIEGDSRRWHTLFNSFEIDRLRDNAAQLAGWRTLRFTWREITEQPERVVATIRRALEDQRI